MRRLSPGAFHAAILLLLSGCFGPEVYPTSLSARPTVLEEGFGTEYGPELFPSSPGDSWTYIGQTWGMKHVVSDETVPLNGKETQVWKTSDSSFTFDRWVRVTDSMVSDFGDPLGFCPCSIARLHFPVRVGKKWRSGCDVAYLETEATVEAVEEMGCPLGLFSAVRVRYDVSIGGAGAGAQTWWFVPGLGVIQKDEVGQRWVLRAAEVSGLEEERAAATLQP